MSRRAKKIEKRVSVDPKFNSELIAHVIRVIMKDGKKTTAERIVYGAVDKIKEAVEKDPSKFEKGEGDQKAAFRTSLVEPITLKPSGMAVMVSPCDIHTCEFCSKPLKSGLVTSTVWRWARPYSRLSLFSTLPPKE